MSDGDDKRTVAERIADTGLDSDRFINVHDGEKGTHDHDTRFSDPRDVPGQNYGIYPGDGLVDVDIDDYSDTADNDGLAAILDLPETLAAKSPHTDGGTGGHRYYVVEGGATDALTDTFGTANPQPSWGEVRAANQYVVGPGSQLDGCDKDWCDECATPDGGWYLVATDAPIATVTTEEFIDALRADPDLSTGADRTEADGGDAPPRGNVDASDYDPAGTSLDDVIPEESKLATYLAAGAKAAGYEANDGGDDRSRADYYAACVAAEYGVSEDEIRDRLADSPHSKVGSSDAPRDYWRRTWSKAVTEADANSKGPAAADGDTHTDRLDSGAEMSYTTVVSGKVRYSVRYGGETLHSVVDGLDLLGSDQKRRTFANSARDALTGRDEIDGEQVKREILAWFSEVNDGGEAEKRERFMSETARDIIDGTQSVTVFEGENSIWEVELSLKGKTESLEFTVDEIGATNGRALEKSILNYWHEFVELSDDDWMAIREQWAEQKTVTQVHERTADAVADSILRHIIRSVRPVTDRDLLANDPACAWYDHTNAAGYDGAGHAPDDAVLWVQDEFLLDQLEAAGKQVEYKGQLVKDLIRRGELYGKRKRRRWLDGKRVKVYPFDPERLGVDTEDIDDGDTSPTSEVEA